MAEPKEDGGESSGKKVEIEPSEAEIQAKLEKIFGKGHQRCPAGVADIVTDKLLIEIKHVQNWSNSIGQILKYSDHFPNRRLIVYLFGKWSDSYSWPSIQNACRKAGIEVLRDDLHFSILQELAKQSTDCHCATEDIDNAILSQPITVEMPKKEDILDMVDFHMTQETTIQALKCVTTAVRVLHPAKRQELQDALYKGFVTLQDAAASMLAIIEQISDIDSNAALFIEEAFTIMPGSTTLGSEFRKALHAWCDRRGLYPPSKFAPKINELLASMHVLRTKKRGVIVYEGMTIKDRSLLKDDMAKPFRDRGEE